MSNIKEEKKLPNGFESLLKPIIGDSYFEAFKIAMSDNPSVSIRLNKFKTKNEWKIAEYLNPQPIPWCEEGYYLSSRPNFTFDPLFHAGFYYVQDAASMFISYILKNVVKDPVLLLDLCAAPGGKTICARSSLPPKSLVISNEAITKRANILVENVKKFGHPDVIVTNNYPRDYHKAKLKADIVIADVPCSGEGMFRKEQHAIEQWEPKLVDACAKLQRSIIKDIWDNIVEGGYLIYSTCTLNTKENEENIQWILREFNAETVDIPITKKWNIVGSLIDTTLNVYRFIPGVTKTEGLFITVIKKKGNKFGSAFEKIGANVTKYLSKLNIMFTGKEKGIVKGGKIFPPQSEALSIIRTDNTVIKVDVDYDTIMKYLRRESIVFKETIPKGIILLTYKKQPIGFINNICTRANNLYPQEWRIRSSYIPTDPIEIIEHKN